MKRTRFGLKPAMIAAAGVLFVFQIGSSSYAQLPSPSTQNWTPTGAGAANRTWDLVTSNWSPNSTWTNGNDAVFSGAPNDVTIAVGGVTANSITVSTSSGVSAFLGGPLALSGASSIVANTDVRIYSVITGSGLNKSGAGTLQLNGVNTYTGATNVTDGVLQNGINNALPTATNLAITGASSTYDLNGHTQTVGSVIVQNGGTLDDQVGGGRLTSATAYDLQDGSVFAVLAGAVGLNKSTVGSITLYSSNSYTGDTHVSGGTLVLGSDGALPSTTHLFLDSSTATMDLSGVHSSVTGVSLVHGAITDSFGGGSLTSATNFDMQDGTVDAILAGAVGLDKTTGGTVTLKGDNTYTGITTVSAGSLFINGSVAGDAQAVPGGILGGSGRVGGNVNNSGTVNPGDGATPGTLTIGGDYIQASAGTLSLTVASGVSYGRLVVGGRASLDGTLQVAYATGFHPSAGQVFTIIATTGGSSGKFSLLTAPQNNLMPVIVYQANNVLLEYLTDSFAALPNLTPNQLSVARALDRVRKDPRSANLVKFLNAESGSSLTRAFDLIAPAEIGAVFNQAVASADVQAANLGRRFDEIHDGNGTGFSTLALMFHGADGGLEPVGGSDANDGKDLKTVKESPLLRQSSGDQRWGYFITGDGEFSSIGGDFNAHGYDFTTAGTTLGLDYRLCPTFTIGLTVGYVHTSMNLIDNGSIGIDGGDAGIYATWFDRGWYIDASATGGGNNYEFRRTALKGQATGSTSGGQFDGFLRGGYDLHKSSWTFGPVVDLQYTNAGISDFTEQGSLAPLHIENQHGESLQSRLGFRLVDQVKVFSKMLRPELRLGWQHEYLNSSYGTTARFASGAGNVFSVTTPVLGSDSLLVTAGFTVELSPRISTSLYYDGQYGATRSTSQTISGAVEVSF